MAMQPQAWSRALAIDATKPIGTGGFAARVLRGSAFTTIGFALSNLLRLGSNLILARLLFPDAFGIMALVIVVMVGLTMFSDIGITPSIQSSKRGDDPDFLNTAWTIQLIRSVALFVLACALAWPMAWFYDQPDLLQLIPVTALSLLILSVQPTRIDTASRHMQLGRLTVIELASQAFSILVMLVIAWLTQSVWALVAGNVLAVATKVALAWAVLPGIVNRPRWERAAAKELIHYGKWIFFSTVAGFVVLQSDKLILGRYLTMEQLGLYNIGYFLASFPLLLGYALVTRLMVPIYRESPPSESPANFARLRRVRFGLTGVLLAMMVPLALGGVWLVDLLYDARYTVSGTIVVMVSIALLPQILIMTYDAVALASGDSRGFFIVVATRAVFLVTMMVFAVPSAGITGAVLAIGLSPVLSYPLLVRLARRHGAWDPMHDAAMGALAALLVPCALWLHWSTLIDLLAP